MDKNKAIQILIQVAEMACKAGLFDLNGANTVAEAVQVIAKEIEVQETETPT